MKYNRLGATDISISAVSLGGAPFSNSIYGPVNEEVTKSVIHAALDAGINYIDTAFWYGQGASETAIGKALASVPRERYSIATKIGLYFPEKERMLDYSAERTLTQVDEALNRLQLPYLDVMQVHEVGWAPNEDVVLSECLPALQKAKEAGKIRHIGITSYSLDAVRNIVEKSRVKIDTVLSYCRGCMFDETLLDHLEFFKVSPIQSCMRKLQRMYCFGLPISRYSQQWNNITVGKKITASSLIRRITKLFNRQQCRARKRMLNFDDFYFHWVDFYCLFFLLLYLRSVVLAK